MGGLYVLTARRLLVLAVLAHATALAAAPRMYVAASGADGNPCTTAAPCRTLQYAVSAVDPDGEVIVVDSAGYGPMAITKSVSVIAPRGIYAGITVGTGIGVDIDAPGVRVTLEGLTINGIGAGTTGVRFSAGAELRLVGCTVSGMTGTGLVATAPGARVFLHDTALIANDTGATITWLAASLDNVRVTGNRTGLVVGAAARVSLRGGSVTGSAGYGIVLASASGTKTTLAVDSVSIAQNATGVSVTATGAGSTVYAGFVRSTIVRNAGDGILVDATAPAMAVVTLTANEISDQVAGVRAQNSGVTVLATGNTIARNTGSGLVQAGGATLQSLANNIIDPARSPPTSGTITTVSGY